jgi:hypothetical protein
MLVHCKCGRLIDKSSCDRKEGERFIKKCVFCGSSVEVYIKYKPITTLLTKDKKK